MHTPHSFLPATTTSAVSKHLSDSGATCLLHATHFLKNTGCDHGASAMGRTQSLAWCSLQRVTTIDLSRSKIEEITPDRRACPSNYCRAASGDALRPPKGLIPSFAQKEFSDLTPLIRKLAKTYGKLSICVSVALLNMGQSQKPGIQHKNLPMMLRIMGRAKRPQQTPCLAPTPLQAAGS